MFIVLPMLASATTVSDVQSSYCLSETRGEEAEPTESLYGEWWLVGWNDKGTWVEVDTNYVCHRHLSIELKEEDYVMAYSMVNEIFVGLLTLNGNEMQFSGEMQRMSTKVGCDLMENNFFEDHICDINSYQLEGKQLRLYYTDRDYFVFTKDFDDSEGFFYEWKNGPVDPYIGEVTLMSNSEVEVKIIQSPSYVMFYSRTVPPMGNREICHFASSDLAGLSFEVGDKVAFRIVQFQRMKTSSTREYQLKVESCKGSEHVTDKTGTMHNDRRMGWIIIDDEVNERLDGIYYYPLKNLPEEYLTEGLPVKFSGELYPSWITPWDVSGLSECYYLSIDAIAQTYNHQEYRPLVEEGKHWTYDNFMPLRPAEYDHYYYYDLKGDTLIAGKNCLKIYSDNLSNGHTVNYQASLYEENKKVYCFPSGKEEAVLLYDFDCVVGDTIQVEEGKMVLKDIRMEDNGGIAIRKYVFQIIAKYAEEYGDICWIEGVGSMKDFFGMLPLDGNYNSLNACEVNGEKLYQWIEPEQTDEGYHKMGIEGKRWNYIHYYVDENGEHRDPYSYVVKGDTIMKRNTYKKLWCQDENTEHLVCLLLEAGRTVYKNDDFGNNTYGEPILRYFFEFERQDFGRVYTWKSEVNSGNTNWMVYGVDTIEVKGQPFRRYTCLQKYSEEGETLTTIEYDGEGVWHDIWVEGVGSASSGIEDQIPNGEPPVKSPNDYTYFVSCYEDGECIFTADDFNVQTAIEPDIDITYRPFVEDGKVWKVGDITSGNPAQCVEHFYFDGDTIIGGKTCKRMMRQSYVSPDYISQDNSLSYVGAWYEEGQKVYIYDSTNNQFKLMYDFSIDGNDTIEIDNLTYVIGPRQTGGINGFKGVYRNVRLWVDGESIYSVPWLEGVGGTDRPTTNVYPGYVDPLWALMSCTVGDEVIYLNDTWEDGATPESAEARKRIDFTHTIKTNPKAPMKREAERPEGESAGMEDSEVQPLYGEYNNLQLSINLDPLDEAYQVSITDESGKIVYEKNVNAGTIVGLNIDISAYPEGRYTVSLENSHESYIGEFDAQTAGISDAKRLNDKEQRIKNGSTPSTGSGTGSPQVYDLQGRRVQTSNFFDERSGKAERKLQTSKLFIVGGKKVVVQ